MGLIREGTTQSGGGALFRRRERIREDGVSCQMKALQRGEANLVKWRTLLREGFFKGNVWDIRWGLIRGA